MGELVEELFLFKEKMEEANLALQREITNLEKVTRSQFERHQKEIEKLKAEHIIAIEKKKQEAKESTEESKATLEKLDITLNNARAIGTHLIRMHSELEEKARGLQTDINNRKNAITQLKFGYFNMDKE